VHIRCTQMCAADSYALDDFIVLLILWFLGSQSALANREYGDLRVTSLKMVSKT
jgi:hypothetical protein